MRKLKGISWTVTNAFVVVLSLLGADNWVQIQSPFTLVQIEAFIIIQYQPHLHSHLHYPSSSDSFTTTSRSSSSSTWFFPTLCSRSPDVKSTASTKTNQKEAITSPPRPPLPQSQSQPQPQPQPLPMGISRELDELEKGATLTKFIESPTTTPSNCNSEQPHHQRSIQVTKLSQRPPIFRLQGVLTLDECQYIVEYAKQREHQMEMAQTQIGGRDSQDQDYRIGSKVLWIPYNQHHHDYHHDDGDEQWNGFNLTRLAQSIHKVFLPFEPELFLFDGKTVTNANHRGAGGRSGVEELQVVRYDFNGEFRLHHDGDYRILTVLYYLNGVSGTWFPLADHPHRFVTRNEALQQAAITTNTATMTPTAIQDGLTVSSSSHTGSIQQPGDAIAFYNYYQDGTVDWNAIHAGLPTNTSEKWIATHWYHHVPSPLPSPSPSPLQGENKLMESS